jgi:hypothetical protein
MGGYALKLHQEYYFKSFEAAFMTNLNTKTIWRRCHVIKGSYFIGNPDLLSLGSRSTAAGR